MTFVSTASAATFQITLANDAVVEGPEFALLALSVPAGAAALGAQSTATLTIVDRTPPRQSSSRAPPTRCWRPPAWPRSRSCARAIWSRRPACTTRRSTGGTATAGVDYTPVTGTVTFPRRVWRACTSRFRSLRDLVVEGPETVNLALSARRRASRWAPAPRPCSRSSTRPAYTFTEIATTSDDGFRSLGAAADQRRRRGGLRGHARRRHDGDPDQRRLHPAGHRSSPRPSSRTSRSTTPATWPSAGPSPTAGTACSACRPPRCRSSR